MHAWIPECGSGKIWRADECAVVCPMNQEDVGDSAEHGSHGDVAHASAKSRFFATLLLIFCCGHAMFLIFSIMPRSRGQDDPGSPAMDLYRLVTGGRQVWNMFETIPILHSLDARLEAGDATGRRITAGCVLPGFMPYPKPETSRYYILFHRMLATSSGAAVREAYLRKIAQLSSAQRGSGIGGPWSLVMDVEYTRNLFHIRRDGQISMPVTKVFGPANQGGNPP